MDDFTIARLLHVLSIVIWIGGVAFVTTVAMPTIRRIYAPDERLAAFHRLESVFAWQARLWVALAGASGLWMIYRAGLWTRFLDLHFWWMHAMAALWLVFALMLFVFEPLVLHRRMQASPTPARDFDRIELIHQALCAAAIVTIVGAMAGSHGLI